MKQILFSILLVFIAKLTTAQFVAKMEIKEPINGLCHNDVYALLPFNGQKMPVCLTNEDSIVAKLNREVSYFQDSSSYDDKGMVSIIINCKGEAVQCKIDNTTRHPELDKQIVAVFATVTKWTPGKIKKQDVDCVKLWSFKIINGQFIID